MRIVGLQIESFKRIKVFSLAPKGNVIKISGANASGKTSALDAIQLALAGTRGGPSAPVRVGAGRGQVKIDLGDFVVTRMWNEGGDTKGEMWIEAKDGMQYPTPQKILDNLMGKISFDPLAFIRMESKAQRAELTKLIDVEEDLADLKAKEQVDYNTRRERSTYLDQLKAQRLALQYPADLPAKKRDIDAMLRELADASSYNVNLERDRVARANLATELEAANERIADKQERIRAMEGELRRLRGELTEEVEAEKRQRAALAKLKPLPEPKNAQALSEAITSARAINTAIDRKNEALAKDAEMERVDKEIGKLNDAITRHRKLQTDLITNAKYPVKGLGFSDEGVTYNGLPFEQASNAEQIEVSVAMGMAANPKLRVMRIKDGSLLDDNAMAAVERMANEQDFQIWVEVVDTTGKVGVYLEDGEIRAVDGEAPQPFKLAAPLGPPRKKPARRDSQTPA